MCAIFGGAIAYVNDLTAPIIAEQAMAAEAALFAELDPNATFSELDISSDETGLIKKGYYGEGAGKYWVYSASVLGFNSGTPIDFLIGFDQDGTIVLYNVITQQETEGIGSRITTDEFEVKGLTANDGISPLSGATVSSTAVIGGINAAKTLYAEQAGVSVDTTAAAVEVPTVTLADDFSEFEAVCEEIDLNVFSCSAKGYGLIDSANPGEKDDYSNNEVVIIIRPSDKVLVSIELVNFGDTVGIGDKATTDEYFDKYYGVTKDVEVDIVSGATWTSKSVASMVQAALAAME
jgi:Na+-translocating ferredoxin:NAD+ oxidoreductase RnfG subunit